jgi:hypothetical protein
MRFLHPGEFAILVGSLMRSSRATRLGEVLNGAYELNELLSAQESHEVYRATERKNGRGVRVTLLRAEFAQGQVAAVALTDAQLDALRALRLKNEDEDDRWVIFVMLTFFMVALQLGVPLLYDPQLARAQALFAGKVPLVSAGFAVMVVLATARIWVARVATNSVLTRVTSFTMFVVATCVGMLCAAQFSGAVGSFAGIARKVLPWGVSFLFVLFAFGGILRGVRSLPNHFVYGLLVLLASSGSLYGSYRAVVTTVLAGKHWSAAQIVQARTRQVSSPSRLDLDALKPAPSE